jgi:hypothetical protein
VVDAANMMRKCLVTCAFDGGYNWQDFRADLRHKCEIDRLTVEATARLAASTLIIHDESVDFES